MDRRATDVAVLLVAVAALVAVGVAYAMPTASVTNSGNSVTTEYVQLTLGDDSNESYVGNFHATLHYNTRIDKAGNTTYVPTDDAVVVGGKDCVKIGEADVTVSSSGSLKDYHFSLMRGETGTVADGYDFMVKVTVGNRASVEAAATSMAAGAEVYSTDVAAAEGETSVPGTLTVELFVVSETLDKEPPDFVLDNAEFVFRATLAA